MRRSGKILLLLFVNMVILCLAAFMLELKLEHDRRREETKRYEQVRPYYWWSFHTHDGIVIGTGSGPLKLALHPFAGYSNLPNQKTPHFSINNLGYRGGDIRKDEKTKKRIIVVGGSTAFGTGLQNDDETFEQRLEHLLNAEVINAAVIGHGSGQELVYLLTELVDLQPDLVITLNGWNDYSHGLRSPTSKFLGSNGFSQLEEQLKKLKSVTDGSFLTRVSTLYWILFPNITKQLHSLLHSLRIKFFRREQKKREPDLGLASEVYATNITKMKRLSEAFNYKFLCVLQPDRDRKQQYRSFRETAKIRLKQAGIVALDLNELDEQGIKTEWFMDLVHLDGAGNQAIAQIIAKKIAADGLLR
jgi:lysophospholipase L1-like esterase